MTPPDHLLADSAEELFEGAPCGYLTTRMDGTIVRVNRTFEEWTGHRREDLLAGRRFQELLTTGGQIYHETHYAPLLQMQGAVREIALDIVRADGTRLPALVNAVVRRTEDGERLIRTTVFDATDRRRYEEELVRAREREHEIALRLQRSLLAGELPDDGRLRTDVAYRPAERGLEVGGDWYDAFWLPAPATVGVVVGDVVGRGIEAAATMGQLRSAVRALASTDPAPGGVLEALDRYARQHAVGQMATVAYAAVELTTRTVTYACAGHPPPVVAEPGRAARLLWDGRSAPLDAHPAPQPRSQGTAELAPGALFVLYTDGLVERRDRPVGVWFDDLLAAVDRVCGGHDARKAAAALVDELADPAAAPDDVCVLVVGLPEPADLGQSAP